MNNMSEKDFKNVDLSEIIEKLQVGMSFTTKFDGKSIEALCLDSTDEGKIVMLFSEIQEAFDKRGYNSWRDSSIRKKLNSDEFFCKFDENFMNHIIIKEIHTGDYMTHDRFWLLSHEEIGGNESFLKENHLCKKLKYFDGYNARCFDEILCSPCSWWLRSADSGYGILVGCVSDGGYVYSYSASYNTAVLPVCLIG